MSASGGIGTDFFAAEATPSGSGYPPPTMSESPFYPTPTEAEAKASAQSGYAIPATVILVSIGALLLLAGGLKVCAFIRQRRKRQSYMYTTDMHVELESSSSAMPLNNYTKLQQQTGYKTCRCPQDWSINTLSLMELDSAKSRRQPRLRDIVRIADAFDRIQQERSDTEGDACSETTSLSSSKSGDGECGQMTVVEVELH